MKNLKILSTPVDKGGCGWYRVRQPFEMIKRHTMHDTFIIENDRDANESTQALSVADVVVVRQGGETGMVQIKQIPEFKHLKWVLDIDDNIELISPYSEHYGEYGLFEYKDPASGKWVWKDGNKFDITKNRTRVMSLMTGLREADMVTVTTERLKEYASKYNDNVHVLPNSVDIEKWWKLPLKQNEPLRVGWSGGVSHYEDWYTIKEPLNRLMRKYRFKLVTVGAHFSGIIDEDLRDLVEVHPWVAFEAHSYRMMCMNLDLAIIPLADLPFNYYKSSVKLYEMSAMGVPSLVSLVPPYVDDVKHTENAYGYQDPAEFEHHLEFLINNPDARKTIGENARNWVMSEHNAAIDAKKWTEAYSTLFNK